MYTYIQIRTHMRTTKPLPRQWSYCRHATTCVRRRRTVPSHRYNKRKTAKRSTTKRSAHALAKGQVFFVDSPNLNSG